MQMVQTVLQMVHIVQMVMQISARGAHSANAGANYENSVHGAIGGENGTN